MVGSGEWGKEPQCTSPTSSEIALKNKEEDGEEEAAITYKSVIMTNKNSWMRTGVFSVLFVQHLLCDNYLKLQLE